MATTHVALLRAVNVGGRGVVKMTDLRDAFAGAGCANVRTFIASGNVVFEARGAKPDSLFKRIAAATRDLLGSEPGICFRTLDEIDGVIAANPFGRLVDDRAVKLYVAFLDREPASKPKLPFTAPKELCEITACRPREMFIVSRPKPNRMYGFPNGVVESFGVMSTTRNWNTVTRLAAFARAGARM
jgi:uncharacterized protein (DUF1697 family)